MWVYCLPGSRTWVVALNDVIGEDPVDLVGGAEADGCSSQSGIGTRSGRMRLFAVRNTRTGSTWEYSVSGPEGSSCNGLVFPKSQRTAYENGSVH